MLSFFTDHPLICALALILLDMLLWRLLSVSSSYWRATRLQTAQGRMAVIPNSLAAKAKIINFSRPSDIFGIAVSVQVSPHARPRTVIEALERAMQGCRQLLAKPAPSVALKSAGSPFEAGRMGPGELIGEAGILCDASLPADFSAKTFCTLYRIEKAYLKPCLDARHDISEAMRALLDYRLHSAQTLSQEVPKVLAKKGFLQWLRRRG